LGLKRPRIAEFHAEIDTTSEGKIRQLYAKTFPQ
jgi:hypothetical protein